MQKIVIFGTGELAQRIFYYLRDSEDEVVAFSANKSNIDSEELLGLPVIPFEKIENANAVQTSIQQMMSKRKRCDCNVALHKKNVNWR